MKKKTWACLVLTTAALGLAGCNSSSAATKTKSGTSTATAAASADTKAAPDTVVVYYFHGNRRCPTCIGIQETISSTLNERFVQEMDAKTLVFKEINIDKPENKHFVKEFDLSFSTMVVAANKGTKTVKWENCDKVWPLARDKAALADYTDKNVRKYLALVDKS